MTLLSEHTKSVWISKNKTFSPKDKTKLLHCTVPIAIYHGFVTYVFRISITGGFYTACDT